MENDFTARLIDADKNNFIVFKKVLVTGAPGSGTARVGLALKHLGFGVYGLRDAFGNLDRDAPLWIEAAKAKFDKEGEGAGIEPYGRAEFDKLVGRYDVS
jgi:hypothetical protein